MLLSWEVGFLSEFYETKDYIVRRAKKQSTTDYRIQFLNWQDRIISALQVCHGECNFKIAWLYSSSFSFPRMTWGLSFQKFSHLLQLIPPLFLISLQSISLLSEQGLTDTFIEIYGKRILMNPSVGSNCSYFEPKALAYKKNVREFCFDG